MLRKLIACSVLQSASGAAASPQAAGGIEAGKGFWMGVFRRAAH